MISLRWFLIAVGAITAVLLASPSFSQPPPGADPDSDIGKWFNSLVRDDGLHCCGQQVDCRVAEPGELHYDGDRLFITLNGVSRPVEDKYLVEREDNPMGQSVICRTRFEGIESTLYCVVPFNGG